jgi:hypothetical protein
MNISICANPEFIFHEKGVEVKARTHQPQKNLQYIPYRAIQSVRYSEYSDEKEAQISVWISGNGSTGAGGLAYQWIFNTTGPSVQSIYETLIQKL